MNSPTPTSSGRNPRVPNPRVIVIGGGVTGLTAAYRLLHPDGGAEPAPDAPDVVLLESTDRLGGKILSTPFLGRSVDEGADAFLLRVPWASNLCAELGISTEYISPAASGASVVHGRAAESHTELGSSPLPDGLVAGVPTRLGPLWRSPLLGRSAALRAAMDYVLPRTRMHRGSAASVGDIVSARLGSAVAARVVDPLLGSISAGDVNRIDAATSAPMLGTALGRSRSLMRGLRAVQPAPTGASGAVSPAPIFASFAGGMGKLVDTLRERITRCDLRLGVDVRAVRRAELDEFESGRPLVVETATQTLDADAVIVTAPAHAASRMLAAAPAAADALGRIDYASVAVVTLGVRAQDVEGEFAEAGFLVARSTGLLTTACSFGTSKWPQWSDGEHVVLRVSVGRDNDDRHTKMSDIELRDALIAELSRLPTLRALGDRPDAVADWRVSRWERSLPQYRPGHSDLIDRVDSALAHDLPGVVVAGAACRGLGIPACIRGGDTAATTTAERLRSARAGASR
ncbi:protoporphyrinogen oxidase [Candidatus Poriferisodalis sp.]|uniref:protoporphyrinogen oxidase n=1 Tax=Candidatus Poriferisodalis sp. TaxID=3101277 RepID=UPI003D0B04C8